MKNKLFVVLTITLCLVASSRLAISQSNSAQTGTVHVDLSYPSEYIPIMKTFLKEVNKGLYYTKKNAMNQGRVVFTQIPPGQYVAYSYSIEGGEDNPDMGGGYTYDALCGQNSSYCGNRELIMFPVGAGSIVKGIKVVDWYGANIPAYNEYRLSKSTGGCQQFDSAQYKNAKSRIKDGLSYDLYFGRAWQYVRQAGENSYDAIAYFDKALEVRPQEGAVYSDKGNCFRGGFKCFDMALKCYDKAIEFGFKEAYVFYNRAVCKFELNDLAGMKSDVIKAKELGWSNDYYKLYDK